jgi:hypothetical protein
VVRKNDCTPHQTTYHTLVPTLKRLHSRFTLLRDDETGRSSVNTSNDFYSNKHDCKHNSKHPLVPIPRSIDLSPPNLLKLSDHRPPTGFVGPSNLNQDGNPGHNEGPAAFGLLGNFPSASPRSSLSSSVDQQNFINPINPLAHQTAAPFAGQYIPPSSHQNSLSQSDMSSMSGTNSDWDSLRRLRMVSSMSRMQTIVLLTTPTSHCAATSGCTR